MDYPKEITAEEAELLDSSEDEDYYDEDIDSDDDDEQDFDLFNLEDRDEQ